MGVPPKGQRDLLVSAAAAVAAGSQVEVGELSGMLTHMYDCQQAQLELHPFVVCSVASHSSALQVEETGHWCVEKNRREREGKEALLSCPSS